MGTQPRISHNPGRRTSGKRALPLAAKVADELGLVPTWPNLQTIRLAIESEAKLSRAALAEVVEMFVRAGNEWTGGPRYSPLSDWEQRELSRLNSVDRFWFEDARWRAKFAYQEFREQRRKASEQISC
jgi:hypothetical protein